MRMLLRQIRSGHSQLAALAPVLRRLDRLLDSAVGRVLPGSASRGFDSIAWFVHHSGRSDSPAVTKTGSNSVRYSPRAFETDATEPAVQNSALGSLIRAFGLSTSIAAFVGYTVRGIDKRPERR